MPVEGSDAIWADGAGLSLALALCLTLRRSMRRLSLITVMLITGIITMKLRLPGDSVIQYEGNIYIPIAATTGSHPNPFSVLCYIVQYQYSSQERPSSHCDVPRRATRGGCDRQYSTSLAHGLSARMHRTYLRSVSLTVLGKTIIWEIHHVKYCKQNPIP